MKIYFCLLALTTLPGLHARLQAPGRSLVKTDEEGVTTFDCDAGCDLKKRKVCGEDGLTYYNECLAYCQVRILKSCIERT